jgi:hypothetical protein
VVRSLPLWATWYHTTLGHHVRSPYYSLTENGVVPLCLLLLHDYYSWVLSPHPFLSLSLSLRVYSCTSSSSSSSSSLSFVRSFVAVTSYLTPSSSAPPRLACPPLPSPHHLSPTSRLREFVGPRTRSRITAKDATEQRNRRQQQTTKNTGVEEGGRPGSRSRRQRRLLGMPGFLGFFSLGLAKLDWNAF